MPTIPIVPSSHRSLSRQWSTCCALMFVCVATNGSIRGQEPHDLDVVEATMRPAVERWRADRDVLARRYRAPMSERRRARLAEHHARWQVRLEALDWESLARDARVDAVLLRSAIDRAQSELVFESARDAEVRSLLPFAPVIVELAERRADAGSAAAEDDAATMHELAGAIAARRESTSEAEELGVSGAVARRAALRLGALGRSLEDWFEFRDGYDPRFSWWVRTPYEAVRDELDRYERFLRTEVVGEQDGEEPLVGDPVGRDALIAALGFEFVAYEPEELVAIAERELAWCRVSYGGRLQISVSRTVTGGALSITSRRCTCVPVSNRR